MSKRSSTQPPSERPRTEGGGLVERRESPHKAVIWGAKLETGGGSFECIMLDLSLRGARLRPAQPVAMREQATLVLEKFGRFPGEIIWIGDAEIGLQFTEAPETIANRFGDTKLRLEG